MDSVRLRLLPLLVCGIASLQRIGRYLESVVVADSLQALAGGSLGSRSSSQQSRSVRRWLMARKWSNIDAKAGLITENGLPVSYGVASRDQH